MSSRKAKRASRVDSADEELDKDMNVDVKSEIIKITHICEEGLQADKSVVVQVSNLVLPFCLQTKGNCLHGFQTPSSGIVLTVLSMHEKSMKLIVVLMRNQAKLFLRTVRNSQ